MSDLDPIMLEAIRYRAAMPGGDVGSAARDRAWLLSRLDALRAASSALVEAVDGGADCYEARDEVEAIRALLGIQPPPWRAP